MLTHSAYTDLKNTLSLISFSIWIAGCSTRTTIVDFENAPKDNPIEVLTKQGVHHFFDHWQLDDQRGIIGFVEASEPSPSKQWHTYRISADSVQSVALINKSVETMYDVGLIVLGAAAYLLILWISLSGIQFQWK